MRNQNPMPPERRVSRLSNPTPEREALLIEWLSVYEIVFPNHGESTSEAKVAAYSTLLSDLSEADLAYGLEQAAKRCKRYPTPGHIRELIEARDGRPQYSFELRKEGLRH